MANTKTVTLDYPFEHDGREVKELQFRRMRAGDALVAEDEKNETRSGYMLMAELAGVDVDVIKMLDMADLEKVGEAIEAQMGKSQNSKTATAEARPAGAT